jgi:hypothetical protein
MIENNIKQIEKELTKIIDDFKEKIGGIGEEDYNEDLDDICCRLLDLRQLF